MHTLTQSKSSFDRLEKYVRSISRGKSHHTHIQTEKSREWSLNKAKGKSHLFVPLQELASVVGFSTATAIHNFFHQPLKQTQTPSWRLLLTVWTWCVELIYTKLWVEYITLWTTHAHCCLSITSYYHPITLKLWINDTFWCLHTRNTQKDVIYLYRADKQ